jgi:hypothetical protein
MTVGYEKYERYVAWMRLTHNGRRGREQMPPQAQREWDTLGITGVLPPDPEQAHRAYVEVTAD